VGDRRRLLTTQNRIPVSVTACAFATGGQIVDYEHAKGVFATYLDSPGQRLLSESPLSAFFHRSHVLWRKCAIVNCRKVQSTIGVCAFLVGGESL